MSLSPIHSYQANKTFVLSAILGHDWVGLIDFDVSVCCPYQCKWLPGGPSPKRPVMCRARC